MLTILRQKNVRRNVLWAISGIIIVSFGFGFGISSYSGAVSVTDAAGKVFGRTVAIKDFQKYYQATTDQAVLMHGENYKKVLPFLDLESETWTRIMLLKEAERRRIKTSDAEVVSYIQSMPFFQREGGFDQALYENILRFAFNQNARNFEEGIRDQIKIMKMLRAETGAINIPDEAVRKEYERRNQKTQVSYILIDPKDLSKAVQLDETVLQAYYDANKAEFLTPDSVKVSYVTLRLGEKATDEDKAKARAKAQELFDKISQGADFNESAKAAGLSVDETGFFSMDNPEISQGWSLDLLQQIFASPKGTVLPPAEAVSGIQIIKVVDLKPSSIPEFSQTKDAVKEKILADKTLELAKAKAQDALTALREKISLGSSFSDAAKTLKLEAKKTPFFTLGDYIPEIGISDDFQRAATDLTKEKPLSEVVLTPKGPAILYQEAVESIDEKKFEEVKKDFTATLYEENRIAAMNRVIKEIREKAKLENYLGRLKQK